MTAEEQIEQLRQDNLLLLRDLNVALARVNELEERLARITMLLQNAP